MPSGSVSSLPGPRDGLPAPPPGRSRSWLIPAVGAVTALAIWALLATDAWRMRVDGLADADRAAATLAQVLEEQTLRTVHGIDAALLSLGAAVPRSASGEPVADPATDGLIRSRLGSLPYVRALGVADRTGRLVQGQVRGITGAEPLRVSFADRELFLVHRDGTAQGLYVGPPERGPVTGRWAVFVSRRLEDRQGRFTGVVGAALEPEYFQRYYAGLAQRPGESLALLTRNGILVARHPHVPGAIGGSLAEARLFRELLAQSANGTFRAVSPVDRVPRHLAYRSVSGLQLVVVAGVSEEQALAAWREALVTHGSAGLIATVAVALLGALLARQRARREALTRALAEREGRFRALVEHAGEGVALFSAEGVAVYATPPAARMLGVEVHDWVGRHLLEQVHRADRPAVEAALRGLLDRPGATDTLRAQVRHRDGSWRHLEGTLTNLLHEPAVRAIVANIRDVTERERLEAELREAQKMEAIGRLAGGLAHDFNNLLTVITGRSEMLLAQPALSERQHRDVELIRRAAERAGTLTSQLLAFGRKQLLRPRPTDLNAMVGGMVPVLQQVVGERVEVQTRIEPGAGWVMADPGQLEQALLALAANARDAMPDGGGLTLATSAAPPAGSPTDQPGTPAGPRARLAVSDTGQGMDAKTRQHLFEPFFTTKRLGRGTGLGLASVHGIVAQSGGQIVVDSLPGRGTTFEIYLPAIPAPASVAVAGTAAASRPRGTETILLVEDEEGVRELARDILRDCGYTVLEAPGPEEALALAAGAGAPVHLLLTDVIMTAMNGKALADRLTRARPGLRVLYMSGYTDDALADHGVLEPGIAFIEKPFTAAGLATKVRQVLDAPGGNP